MWHGIMRKNISRKRNDNKLNPLSGISIGAGNGIVNKSCGVSWRHRRNSM